MGTSSFIGSILGVAFVLCLLHFTMRGLIRSELNMNAYQKDDFNFRLRATKAPLFLLLVFIVGTYAPAFFGLLLVPGPWGFLFRILYRINTNVWVVLLIAIPIVLYNLFGYEKDEEAE
jgi:hypothetical protein